MRLTRKLGMAIMAIMALTASSCVTLHRHRPQRKGKEAMEKLITDIAAVLTSDQQVLYKQLQEEAAAERKKHTRKN
ncbi:MULTISPECIES: hypothetical protein [Bacteroidaceae]|uniref:hypothetical protein n=1 Tax=Bacteroidaceae TaxID=815 RepID=UPI001123FF55|nr:MULTISPECIES: hypothetical protein [unclassified Bacteroides]